MTETLDGAPVQSTVLRLGGTTKVADSGEKLGEKEMRHKWILFGLLVFAIGATASVAAASEGAHFTQGGSPVCTDIGLQLECTAEIAGLGQQRVVGTIDAPGALAVNNTCTNKGGNEAPGQNPAVDFTAGGSAVGVVDKNGRASIDATTTLPSVSAKDAGCPNGKWTVTVGDVIFNSYSFTITQGQQTLFTCTGSFPGGSEDNDSSTPSCA